MYDISVALPSYIPWARTETHVKLDVSHHLRMEYTSGGTSTRAGRVARAPNFTSQFQRASRQPTGVNQEPPPPPPPARSPKTEHITFIATHSIGGAVSLSRCGVPNRSIDLPFCGSIHHHLFVGVVFGKAFFGSLQDKRTSC